ncbi:aspartate/glutamate racemase family protein [Mesorhizobium sp. KR1-2]|uniref:aspartate/glutamate racemase family protein n=1 Tax=Mesorhizobium sp. KR1-2 TaxID=3156609 RepID=UPI0032B5A0F5
MTRQSKLIGMVGGMSWESSAIYYRLLNQGAGARLGGHHNARSLMYTLDFDEINRMAALGRWDVVAERVGDAARWLEKAGADLVMLTAVSAHRVFEDVQAAVSVPLLHVGDPTAQSIKARGLSRVGLLGTRYTMEQDFLSGRLRGHGLDVMTPNPEQRERLHRVIIDELTLGKVEDASRGALLEMTADLEARGAQAFILGCTELPLLVGTGDYPLPAFDATELHAEAALDIALADMLT